MSRFISIVLACTICVCCVFSSTIRAEKEPETGTQPATPKAETPAVKQWGDKAVVKDVVYGIEEEASCLYLTSQGLDDSKREILRIKLKFVIPADNQIVEVSLAKLGNKNLVAVLKLRRGNEYDFHCLTLIAPWGGHVRDGRAFHEHKFLTTREHLLILGLNGNHYNGSVFVVLGNTSLDKSGVTSVTEGTFFFSGCPWPPYGELSPFQAKSSPPNRP